MSVVQCPVCALRFRYQSELEAHAHDDHCISPEVHARTPDAEPRRDERGLDEPAVTSRLLRYP